MSNTKVQVIQVPYDSGQRGMRMGRGPEYLVSHGLAAVLRAEGHEVWTESVESQTEFRAEIKTQFELYRLLAERVREAHRERKFPLILSGNCGATLGALAGAGTDELGMIWFDAHGDFNTPETTTSGFLDGMGLAIAAGLCWQKLAAAIPNFMPVSSTSILHIGGRDFDAGERERFAQAGATVVDAAAIKQHGVRAALTPALAQIRSVVKAAHLHIDLDVLNPQEAPANEYITEAGGLSVAEVVAAVGFIKEHLGISSATIAALDPKYDVLEQTLAAGYKLIRAIIST
jgi:arginase